MQSIQTTDELTAVVARSDVLWGTQAGAAAGIELDPLVDLVIHHEGKHFRIEQQSLPTRAPVVQAHDRTA